MSFPHVTFECRREPTFARLEMFNVHVDLGRPTSFLPCCQVSARIDRPGAWDPRDSPVLAGLKGRDLSPLFRVPRSEAPPVTNC